VHHHGNREAKEDDRVANFDGFVQKQTNSSSFLRKRVRALLSAFPFLRRFHISKPFLFFIPSSPSPSNLPLPPSLRRSNLLLLRRLSPPRLPSLRNQRKAHSHQHKRRMPTGPSRQPIRTLSAPAGLLGNCNEGRLRVLF